MTTKHLQILGHSLGINTYHAKKSKKKKDKTLPNDFYRNGFCASEGHNDLPLIEELLKMGYMTKGSTINNGTSTYYHVSENGIIRFRELFEAYLIQ